MHPRLFLACFQVRTRKLLYGFISVLVIGSMLLQPVAAIAVIVQRERTKVIAAASTVQNTDETGEADSRSAPEEMSTVDRSRIAAALPKPAKRLLAQVSPTPSYARPVYPYNHILDSSWAALGSPPLNHDFETLPAAGAAPPYNHDFQLPAMGGGTQPANYDFQSPVMSGGSPPANYDFSVAPYQIGTLPTNHNFETGTLTGWTSTGTTLIPNDLVYGTWAKVQSGSLISDPFIVDSNAQRITFATNRPSSGSATVYLHAGGVRTAIGTLPSCNGVCNWVTYSISMVGYVGQSVKIEFQRTGGFVGFDDVRVEVLLPGYTADGDVSRIVENNGNVYARLSKNSLTERGVITTTAFLVGNDAQRLTFSLIGLGASSDGYKVHLLSGANYATVTSLAFSTVDNSWQTFTYPISQWQGQWIKLRVLSYSGTMGVDNIGIQSTQLANYKISDSVSRGEESNGNVFARLAGNSGAITTTTFTIGNGVQELKLSLSGLTAASDQYKVDLLSAATGALLYQLETGKSASDSWQQITYLVSNWQGQSVKLRISSIYGTVGVDDVAAQTMTLSGYTLAGPVTQVEEGNGNRYARLAGGAVITTSAFTIGSAVQQLALQVIGLTASVDDYVVQALSGPGYTTVTPLETGTEAADSWQPVIYNVTALQGRSVKLRIATATAYDVVGIDNIGNQTTSLPGWEVSGDAELVTEGNGNHYVSTTGVLTSSLITLNSEIQQIALRYRGIGSATLDRFIVKLLRMSTGEEINLTTSSIVATTDWQILKIGLNRYAGETVRLKLQREYGRVQFDDVGEGEALLRGWQITTADGIATATDNYGSYVTSAEGTVFMIHSELIGLGVIDRPNRVDIRYYSIAYDLGPGNSLSVVWRNEQGADYTVFQTASNTQTGYQEKYFPVQDVAGTVGRFYIKATGAGKVYSIADNIARQHLAEPFSYKVGTRIDTATGSFGYSTLDLQMDEIFPLVFTRYYNGHSDRPGVLGHGWSHSYETRLEIDEQRGHAGGVFGSGKEVFFFYRSSSNSFVAADVRIQDRLLKNNDGTYTYLMKATPAAPYSTDNQCSDVAWHQVQIRPENLEYHFAADGKLTSIRDRNGIAVTLNYVNNQLATVVSQSGAAFTLTYNTSGQLETVQSTWAGTATYGYDGSDLISVTRTDQGTETYTFYDHKLWRITDANNHTVVENTFDAFHRVTAQTDARNDTFTIEYNTPAPGVTAVHYPDFETHHFYYDQYQRTTDWVAPTGEVTSYLYDGVGNLQKVIDSGLGEWNFSYDESANLLGLADPQGDPLLISYNPEYLPTSITDGNGNVTTIQYAGDGKIEKITTGGEETAYTYTALGQTATVTSPWRQERYTYYPLDGTIRASKMATRSLGPVGAEKTWVYSYELFVNEGNVLGRKELVTDPNGHTTTTIYNRANRIVALRDHTGAQKKFLYDPVGHLLMAEDELGRRTYWDYNTVGLVEKKTDPEGFNTFYAYDANRNMTSMTDPNGLVTSYEYDGSNRLTKTTLPGNRVTTYAYDGCGRITAQQNPRGQTTSYTYDLGGQLITMTMPLNAVYGFEYDGNGNVRKAIDPLHYVTEQSYDALNRPLTVKDGAGFITQYQYDQDNREIRTVNPLGETTTYRYNLLGQMSAMVNPLQQTTAFAYDGVGNRTAITDTLGYVERFAYDAVNRPEYYKNKAGRLTQFVYDAAGQLKQIIEPTTQATRVTAFDYWGRGMLKSVTNALGQPPMQYVYDAGGRLTNTWEPDGKGTKYHYYPDTGLLEKVLDRVDKATHYEYDLMGNVTAVIDPLGRRATYEYDELNRLKKAAAPNSAPTEYKYYANGKLKELWTPAQRPTYYAYDGRGLVTSVTDAFGHAMHYTYDEAGRLATVTDRRQAQPNVLEYLYDGGGRLTDLRVASGFNNLGVHYQYDGANRLTAVTDPNGLTTSYTYNALDQVRTETQPISRTTTYTYDEYNRLWVTEDPRDVEVTYTYDPLDGVKQVTYPGGQNTFEYDILGRLDWYSDPTGVTNYGYDDASRVNQIVAPQGAVGYDYYDDGQRKSMTLDAGAPDARTVNYGYNNQGQLATITDWQGRANTLTYDPDGNLAGIARYNNVNTAYTYDAAGRLDALNHNGPAGPLAWFDYTLDEMGNRTALDSSGGHEDYGIDNLNRLYAATYAGGDESYQYHPNGDRSSAEGAFGYYHYNADGQLEYRHASTLDKSWHFDYDENGNTTTITDDNNQPQADSYTWDWANRLTSASVDGQTVNYAYDAMGVRVSATISGTTQNLLWDRMAELPLLVDDGNQSYLHGAGPLAQIDAAGTRYDLLADGLGSVRNLIDGNGAVVGAADYTMFGEYRNQTGVTSRFGFTGEYYAQETGMWHLRARDLHPSLGRFLSADPVQPNAPGTQGYNRYAYVANNPTTWVDPSGHEVDPAAADLALMGMMYAMRGGIVGILHCALDEECRAMKALMRKLGSRGANLIAWTAEELQGAFFSTYPHQPTPVDPGLLVLSIGLSNTPIIGDLYDLYTGVTGYDPITGQYLAGWERLANIVGALPIFGVSGGNIRHGEQAFESMIDSGDELGQLISAGGKTCSFDEETSVATDEGSIPIREVDVGDHVLAWKETLGETSYYTVTDAYTSVHEVLVYLTIDGEDLTTTPEHPFLQADGEWMPAGRLEVGNEIRNADGEFGTVEAKEFAATPQVMYNMTVADAHTYIVGDGEWVVHNECDTAIRSLLSKLPNRKGRGPTSGFLLDSKGNLLIKDLIVSGNTRSLPAALRTMVRDGGTLPENLDMLHHVEMKVARYMEENSITDAVLVLNNLPCQGKMSCSAWLNDSLPVGTTLRVIVPEGFDVRGFFTDLFKGR